MNTNLMRPTYPRYSTRAAVRVARWQWAAALALLLVLFGQLIRGALRNSVTFDEGQHIARGYAYLKTGDLRLNQVRGAHPPGMAILEAAPLLLFPDMPQPATLKGWAESDTVLFAKQLIWKSPEIEKLLFAARVPVMLVTLLLAVFCFRWAADLWGPGAGLLAMALVALDPNIIAHGMLAATDAGVAAFSFIALYALWKSLRRPSPKRLLAAGVTLGLALVAKMSALILLPVSALVILVVGLAVRRRDYFAGFRLIQRIVARARSPRGQRLLGLTLVAVVVYAAGFLTVWAVYRFEVRKLPELPLPFPIPAATHLSIALVSQKHLDVGHVAFLMGELSEHGWWYYFPVAFLIKTPLPTLILLALGGVALIWKEHRRWLRVFPLLAFAGLYALATLLSTVNIGYRHLLPLLPCLFVLASQLVNQTTGRSINQSASQSANRSTGRPVTPSRRHPVTLSPCHLVPFLLAWLAFNALTIFPNDLTFFNELAGGPKEGWKYLVDSNLDWGQSLIELRSYLARNPLGPIRLSSTGFVNPSVYGIAYEPLPPMPDPQDVSKFNPSPGRYYIGAQNLQVGSPLDHDVFGWFREREPQERIANAILVYDVPQRPQGRWAAQCATPSAPLDAEAIAKGFGRDDLRLIAFDCRTSWFYPAGGPGWYVVPQSGSPHPALPAALEREFRTSALSPEPRFTIYRLEAPPGLPANLLAQARIASGSGPVDAGLISAPIKAGPLEFLGSALDQAQVAPGQTVTLTTYWRVASGIGQPVSLMAHLTAADGRVVANGDGLGVTAENWQPGDIIVQKHILAIHHDAASGKYQAQTGIYTVGESRLLNVLAGGSVSGDRLIVAEVEVQR